MTRFAAAWCVVAVLAASAGPRGHAEAAHALWFAPGPGTLDYLRLFEHPEEWPRARSVVSVFKFYQQHTAKPAPAIVGPNSFDALVRVGAFRKLKQWRIKIAVEVGAVKEFYCTPDARGTNDAIAASMSSLTGIESAGGSVSYLAMDDPFAAGQAPVCGGPALEPTADRVATYLRAMRAARPALQIGWIEAYPLSDADAIQSMMALLASRNALPSFLHMDVDLPFLIRRARTDDFLRDMARLRGAAAARGMPFGIIIWGDNGDADPLYSRDAARFVESMISTFQGWDAMPDHIVVQSWAQSSTGLFITPSNLPEDADFTHTSLLWQAFRRLRGQTGPMTGTAVPRTR